MLRYVVYLKLLPYPFGGFELGTKRVSKSDEHIWDSLNPDVIEHVFVEAESVDQAKALGLRKLVEEAKDAKKPCPICLSMN